MRIHVSRGSANFAHQSLLDQKLPIRKVERSTKSTFVLIQIFKEAFTQNC